jgi:hypothetical protein
LADAAICAGDDVLLPTKADTPASRTPPTKRSSIHRFERDLIDGF